ncbi:hypothetical protein [Roseomonas sp. AR75]|uniref:hypothetical protein n=1 Tax=Roseomonas sp. AR75 TaxID=2562311 RepID=UPI0010C0D33D|nr:hypothetical protein [Roseomonas sp. AR75]
MGRQPNPSRRPSRTAATPARLAEATVREAFAHRFVEAQYAWTAMLLDHLVLCRQRLGDLDSVVVLGVLGLSALDAARRELRQASADAAPDHYADKVPPGSAINAQSLADITGIPRETVRRKLAALARAGLIRKLPDGAWCLTPSDGGGARAREELQDVTDAAIGELARLFGRLAGLAEASRAEAVEPATAMAS